MSVFIFGISQDSEAAAVSCERRISTMSGGPTQVSDVQASHVLLCRSTSFPLCKTDHVIMEKSYNSSPDDVPFLLPEQAICGLLLLHTFTHCAAPGYSGILSLNFSCNMQALCTHSLPCVHDISGSTSVKNTDVMKASMLPSAACHLHSLIKHAIHTAIWGGINRPPM